MYLLLFITCMLASSSAWLPPERCAQGHKKRSISNGKENAEVVTNIEQIAAAQLANLKQSYEGYNFDGVPVRPQCDTKPENCEDFSTHFKTMQVFRAYDCSFYTYNPRPLSSVVCGSNNCKLAHTVSTTDTYAASEGYNWGVKIAPKFTIIEKVFEVGGEVSTGGTYSCTYTKGKTTTDTVECTHNAKGILQLYSVRTDMECSFGTTTMTVIREVNMTDIFTHDELVEINDSAAQMIYCCRGIAFMIDTEKISDRTLKKLIKEAGGFDPYKDIVQLFGDAGTILIRKYKIVENETRNTRVIPFTNEHGDSVYQYACLFKSS